MVETTGTPGHIFACNLIQRLHHLRLDCSGRQRLLLRRLIKDHALAFSAIAYVLDGDLWAVEHADEVLTDFFFGMAGQDAAVHDGLRALRQRVVGMAGIEPSGDAGGAQGEIVFRSLAQSLHGLRVRRCLQNGTHIGSGLSRR